MSFYPGQSELKKSGSPCRLWHCFWLFTLRNITAKLIDRYIPADQHISPSLQGKPSDYFRVVWWAWVQMENWLILIVRIDQVMIVLWAHLSYRYVLVTLSRAIWEDHPPSHPRSITGFHYIETECIAYPNIHSSHLP